MFLSFPFQGENSVCIWLVFSTSPLTPLQPERLWIKAILSWLERGVNKERELSLLSTNSPPLKQANNRLLKPGIV